MEKHEEKQRRVRFSDSWAAKIISVLFKMFFVLAAIGLIYFGATLSPQSAIQQIYQLNAVTSGLILLAIIGVWAAIDGDRRR